MPKRSYTDLIKLDLEHLHKNGFIVVSKAFEVDDNIISKLQKQIQSRGQSIFGRDRKRKQCELYKSSKDLCSFTSMLNNLIGTMITNPTYHQSDWVILKSPSDSQRQFFHHDYVPSKAMDECPDHDFPLAVLCSLMPETKLDVYIDGKYKTIELGPGDILIFRGDFTHAGSAYKKENIRLHCYLDNARVPRTPNRTHIVEVDI